MIDDYLKLWEQWATLCVHSQRKTPAALELAERLEWLWGKLSEQEIQAVEQQVRLRMPEACP